MTSSRAMVPAHFQLMQKHAALPQSPSPAVRPAALCRNLKKCAAGWMKSNYVFFFLLQKFAILMEQVGLAHICTKNGHQKYWWC